MNEMNPRAGISDLLDYDPHTGSLTWKRRSEDMFSSRRAAAVWNAKYAGKPALNCDDGHGYRHGRLHRKHLFAHRAAWAIYYGTPVPDRIDHINGDPADNRIINLRAVSNVENGRNSKRSKANKTGVTGVFLDRRRARFIAYISGPDGREYLGNFGHIEDAAEARRLAEVRHGYHQNHGRTGK